MVRSTRSKDNSPPKSFSRTASQLGEREENPYIAAAVSGPFLRVELPRLVTSDLVLYTDCDVIFRDEVVPDLRRLRCDYFTVAPDARESYDDIINSGVMVMNLARLRKTADEFYQVIFDKLDELKADAWDQGAYIAFIAIITGTGGRCRIGAP